jgi:predicted DNA-binding protein with PD1-like motif
MKYATLATGDQPSFMLRLEPGDDVLDTIQSFCRDQTVSNATIQGIGSVEDPTLAHYSMHTKEFHNQTLSGVFEVASLVGNIALVDNQPFAHLHATLAGPDLLSRAGHLVQANCSATLEVLVTSYPTALHKRHDETIGLKVWDF